MTNFDENLIKITEYKVLGKLPDLFAKENGERISKKEEWEEQRKRLYKTAIEFQYGKQPPKPEFVEVEPLYVSNFAKTYRVKTGRRDFPVSFTMRIVAPDKWERFPVVIDGDMCFNYYMDKEYTETFTNEDIALVMFNRVELVCDCGGKDGRPVGPLCDCYPEYDFGALGAWAWGYSRCVDALEIIDRFDLSCITFTGHSRGAKAAIIAGALDERAHIVNPNATCAGGCSCYRVHMKAITEDGEEKESETLKLYFRYFKHWMGTDMFGYEDKEEELPFDAHFLKAMVAPRILFVSEAASDIWANPVGSWQTTMAASEAWKFLDVPENFYWYFRRGYHWHAIEDIKMLVNIIKHKTEGRPLSENFYKLPFKAPELIYDWRAPEKK